MAQLHEWNNYFESILDKKYSKFINNVTIPFKDKELRCIFFCIDEYYFYFIENQRVYMYVWNTSSDEISEIELDDSGKFWFQI